VPAIKAATGATVYAEGPHRAARPLHIGELNPLDASADRDFRPDVALKDGEHVNGDGWTVEAVATPGHTANHMAMRQGEQRLFVGDHGWLVRPWRRPTAMSDHIAAQKTGGGEAIISVTGRPSVTPRFVNYYILHRMAREASILHRLSKGETDILSIVRAIYIGIDPRLTGAAGLSVLAHLEDLVARGVAETDGMPAIDGVFRLAG
jgi:hydroxyacylglutathione hydrolase